MRWCAYSKIKPSGIEWLGEIPEHWEVVRFKYVLWLQRGHDLPATDFHDGKYPVCGSNGCIGYHNQFTTKGPGVTVGRSGSVGEVNYVDTDYWAHNTALYVKEFRRSIPRYAFYLLKMLDVKYLGEGSAVGTLNRNYIHDLPVAVPAVAEQRDIVIFLDRETTRIDALIAGKERQIELLQEKRTALINHAVTKGLNPDVIMKPSGIEWLGEIPEHWEVNRAKILFKEINERSASGEEELLTVSHITGVTRRSEKNVNMFMAESLEDYKICKSRDLVINTMWAWMGAMGIAFELGVVSPSYNVYRFRTSVYEPQFYDYLFRTGRFVSEVIRHSKGVWASRLRLYPEEFFEIRLPCPPPHEQRDIAEAIERKTGKYNELQQLIERSITKLREYRTAFISAAVTGKIDVRKEID